MRAALWRVLLVSALVLPGGCACTLGLGLGAGVEVKLAGVFHSGVLGWWGWELGRNYGHRTPHTLVGVLPFLHGEVSAGPLVGVPRNEEVSHLCFGLAPGVASWGRNDHPWALEVRVAVLFFSVRVGVDPLQECRSQALDPDSASETPEDSDSRSDD